MEKFTVFCIEVSLFQLDAFMLRQGVALIFS